MSVLTYAIIVYLGSDGFGKFFGKKWPPSVYKKNQY